MVNKYTLLTENIMLPLYDLVRKTYRFKFNHVLEKTQWLPRDKIERLQKRNLCILLRHAYETVPYYRRVFKERNLSPSDIKSIDDMVKLPVLTKEDIRKNFKDLISTAFPRKDLVPYKTGGSTGNQIHFYITKEQLSWEIAAEYRAYRWAGYRFGDPCFMFWGSHIDLSKLNSLVSRLTKTLERVYIADSYFMSDENLRKFAFSLNKFNPEIIRGYTTSVYMMSKYLLENGIDSIRPRAVITSAETLFDFMRKTIEEAFDCPVFDYYGSREIGGLAAECEEHVGYHISAENVVMEFVDESKHVTEGEKGLMLLTSLRNFGMPFIRYNIGDVGVPSDTICNCGRNLPLISSIEGRTNEFMAVYDKRQGRVVPIGPMYPVILFALMEVPLKSCRVIQESLSKIVINAVKDKGYEQKHTDYLIDYMHEMLGDNMSIEVKFMDYLPALPSGKRTPFITKINPFENSSIKESAR